MFRWLRVQASHRIVLRCLVVYPVPVTVVVRLLLTLTPRTSAGLRLSRLKGWLTARFTKKILRPGRCDLPFSLRLKPRNYPWRTVQQQPILAEKSLPESFPPKEK